MTPSDLAGFLAAAGRATVAWNRDGQVAAEPTGFRFDTGSYMIGVPQGTLTSGAEVAVLIDGGPMYFDLRGVRIRGPVVAVEDMSDELDWFEVKPEREVAWHYGTLRER